LTKKYLLKGNHAFWYNDGTMAQQRFIGIRAHIGGSYREETLLGRDYMVVPVVMLVEGTLQGMTSTGPELALAEEFGRFPASWDGRPVVMNHPVDEDGTPVSANSPQALKDYQIGQIFHTNVSGRKLLAEAWIDVKRVQTLNSKSKAVYKVLNDGEIVEVSTGYFSQLEETSGEYDGSPYDFIQRNIVPDHFAFLEEGAIGACSIEDGCGAPRMNQSTPFAHFSVNAAPPKVNCSGKPDCQCGGTHQKPTTLSVPELMVEDDNPSGFAAFKQSLLRVLTGADIREERTADTIQVRDEKARKKKKGKKGMLDYAEVMAQAFPDSMLADDARRLVQQALRKDGMSAYVLGLTKDHAIYEAYDPNDGYYKTYSRTYDVAEGGAVTFGDEVQEVNLIMQVLPVANTADATSDGTSPEGTKEHTMPKPNETAPAPGTDPKTHSWKDASGKEYNVTLNADGTVAKVEPVEAKAETTAEAPKPETPTTQEKKPVTVADYISAAPSEVQDVLNESLRMHNSRRDALVAQLKATNRCKIPDDRLKTMKLGELEELAALADIKPTFEGSALPNTSTDGINANEGDGGFEAAPRVFEYGAKADSTSEGAKPATTH
jgi:hypothetical protein